VRFGEESVSVGVRVTIGTEKVDDYPLFMDRKGSNWCVT
jgi:hypothetical protein